MPQAQTYQSEFTGVQMDERFAAVASITAQLQSLVLELADCYTKSEVDQLLAAINGMDYVDVATLPTASASTLGKIYLVGPDASGYYAYYYTSYDGSAYSWVGPLGTTQISLANYATKAELNQLDQKVDSIQYLKGDSLTVDSTADKWQLKGDGYSQSNLNAQMRKFKVVAGTVVYLKLSKDTPGVYQFQDAASVPSSGTLHVVGTPGTEAVDGFFIVPQGATYLIISELKINSTNEVKAATTLLDNVKEQVNVPVNAIQFKNNRYINNNGAYVEDADWAVTPKILCPKGSFVEWGSGYGSSSSVISIVIFNAAGEKLAYYAKSNVSYRDFTVSQDGAAYIVASFYKGATTGYLKINGLTVAKMDADTLLKLSGQVVEVLDNDIIANNIRKEPALASVAAYYGNSNLKVAGKITLLHLSDIHGNTVNLGRVVRYWKHYSAIFSDAIHTGDIVGGLFTDSDPFQSVSGAENILNLIGNHDAWLSASDPDYDATEKQCYDKFFAPNIANWDVVQPTGAAENGYCYYYKDYTTEGYRLIVLDSVHWHYHSGTAQENAAQKAWFESVLADAKTQGLKVICATHYTPQNGITPIPDTGFNLMGATAGGNIADGWYAVDEMFDCVDDFITGGGSFAGWIMGHTHTDYIGTVYGHASQPVVIMGTSGNTSVNNKFIVGTASQDNFNAITFEVINNKSIVKIVKIGQDTDLYTRSKQTIAYNFTDGVLISTT